MPQIHCGKSRQSEEGSTYVITSSVKVIALEFSRGPFALEQNSLWEDTIADAKRPLKNMPRNLSSCIHPITIILHKRIISQPFTVDEDSEGEDGVIRTSGRKDPIETSHIHGEVVVYVQKALVV